MSHPHHRLARSAGIFTSATLLSRILGYFRDTMVAAFFGAGPAADAFYTAFRISNLFRRLLGEGALSASFVPVFSEYTQKKSKKETQLFLNTMVVHDALGDPPRDHGSSASYSPRKSRG